MKMNRRGFTLIELMVVIAIIIILAAIAIPNYINMTKRAQASRATSDAAVLATALEVYKTDNNAYPAALTVSGSDTVLAPEYISNATEAQLLASEESITYLAGTPTDGWTLTILTKDGQQVTRTSDASVAVVGTPPPAVTLVSIAITTPATKLSYAANEPLDISGMVVTGHYSSGPDAPVSVTTGDVSGFDSSSGPVTGQVLTVTVSGKTATYSVDITS